MQQVEAVVADTLWNVGKQVAGVDDPLLSCLLILARSHNRPVTSHALTAGLPLVEHRLTPELFPRAAERAGLCARLVKRRLSDISELVLPAVLLLDGKQACVLTKIDENRIAQVILPDPSAGSREIQMGELELRYAGYAILAAPAHRFDSRATGSAVPRARHWFWDTVARAWPIYGEVLIASLLINLFALATPLFTMNVYDRVVPNGAVATLSAFTVGIALVLGFDFVMRMLRGYFIDVAGKKIDVILSANIFERLLGIQMASRPASVGGFANSLQEFEAFREFITSATITALIDLPFVLLFLAAMFWIGGELTWVPVAALPLVITVSIALQFPLAAAVQASGEAIGQRQATLVESLVGLETIKVMGAETTVQRRWEQLIGRIAKLGLRSRLLSAAAVNFAAFVQQAAYISVVVLGVFLIIEGKLTMGGLIACSILAGRALAPLSQVVALITRYHQCRAGLKSIDRLMHLPTERRDVKDFVHRSQMRGAIEFRNVSFSYPGEKMRVVDDVSFMIKPGERVAILGRIGSGKTTIEKLILGLYSPEAGSILFDGIDQRQIDPAALRRDIGYVPQDIILFRGSVRDNIVLHAPYIDDADMLRAAEIAGVTEFVNRSPRGFELQVGERGEALSGGQRQAIAIARAELLSPPILMMDEPSSAMDARSEERLKARLAMQLADRTLIIISHRASLLSLATRLIVIEQGRLVADGPKEQVLANLAGGKVHVA
jgi:ATP-binding cassette subfamily C protein LapB